MVQFEKRIGGLDRAATVLNELAEAIKPEQINEAFVKQIPVKTLQRLGYLFEKVITMDRISTRLFEQTQKAGLKFFRTPLRINTASNGFPTDEKWKVIINTAMAIDE